jgi:hypothetical protein
MCKDQLVPMHERKVYPNSMIWTGFSCSVISQEKLEESSKRKLNFPAKICSPICDNLPVFYMLRKHLMDVAVHVAC